MDLGYNGKLQFLVINHRPKSFFIEKAGEHMVRPYIIYSNIFNFLSI